MVEWIGDMGTYQANRIFKIARARFKRTCIAARNINYVYLVHTAISVKNGVSQTKTLSVPRKMPRPPFFINSWFNASIVRQFDRQKGVSEQIGFSVAGSVRSVAG